MSDVETPQSHAFYAPETFRQKFWRAMGFRTHLGKEPDGVDSLTGWMRTDMRHRFGWLDRLRLLMTGRLNVTLILHTDTPDPQVCKNRLDWRIVPPGDRE